MITIILTIEIITIIDDDDDDDYYYMIITIIMVIITIMIIPVTITTRTLSVIVDVFYFILQQSCYPYMTNLHNEIVLVINLLIHYLLICILT